MRREIKKSVLVISALLLVYNVILLLNMFVFKNVDPLIAGISASVVFLPMFIMFGLETKKRRFTQETLFYIFFYPVIYVIITYIIGIFTGFNYSIYSLTLKNILKNILPYLFCIGTCELLRAEVTRKCEKAILPFALLTIAFVLIDSTMYLSTFDLNTGDGQIKYICCIVLPSVSKNIFLLYISIIGGYLPTVLYRIVMEIKTFIIPIVPNFGLYFDSILGTMMPVMFGLITFISLKQYQNKEVEGKNYKQSKLFTYSSIVITALIIVLVVSLTSCKFKYGAISIGSGSMTGVINKGDVVVYKQLGDYVPEMNDILVFKKENKLIVHRIIDIVEVNDDEYVYYTKGDANPSPDGYPLLREDLVGIVKFRIPFIGIPSVYIHEVITKKK